MLTTDQVTTVTALLKSISTLTIQGRKNCAATTHKDLVAYCKDIPRTIENGTQLNELHR